MKPFTENITKRWANFFASALGIEEMITFDPSSSSLNWKKSTCWCGIIVTSCDDKLIEF